MEFCDKLNILMKVTQSTNKGIAAEISVDPSLISHLRSGRRGLPRSHEHIRNIAFYFASRCTAQYQRQALSEMTGLASLKAEMHVSALAIQLERWMTGEIEIVEKIQPDAHPNVRRNKLQPKPISNEKTVFYYGDKGRRDAVRHIFSILNDGPVGLFDSSDLSWAVSDHQFTADVTKIINEHLNRGNTFTQILPPMNRIDSYSESLKFMLPIYAGGLAKVYYYPRVQSSPDFHSIMVAPGQCVMCTYGIQAGDAPQITMVSADKELTAAYTEQFREFVAMCRPALKVHKGLNESYPLLNELMTAEGDVSQKTSALSVFTMPARLLDLCISSVRYSPRPEWGEAYKKLRDELPNYEKRLRDNAFLDICRLADAEHIRSGTVPIGCHCKPYDGYPCYTPETYVMHLENILRLMDEYENYTFLPITEEHWSGYDLLVNDSGLALLAKCDNSPAAILEMRRPEMLLACREFLLKIAEQDGALGIGRDRIRIQIRSLIRELQG